MHFVKHEANKTVVTVVNNGADYFVDGYVELVSSDLLFDQLVDELQDGIYTDDGKFVSSFDDYYVSILDELEKAFDESEHPRDEHGKFTDAGGGGEEGGTPPEPSLVTAFPTANVYRNPSIEALKNLTKGADYKSFRFVIDNKGTLLVGDASKLSHQSINPAYMTSAVVGLVNYTPSGGFSFKAHGPFDMIPVDHPLLQKFEQAGIRNEAKGDTSFSFVSPNVKTDLDFAGAVEGLSGAQQEALRTASSDIDRRLDLRTREIDVIGAWADGAENSIMMSSTTDWDHLVLAAAMKAHLADQKSALVFQETADGQAVLSSFKAKGDLADIHKELLQMGLTYHTLVPTKGGAVVYVADIDGSLFDATKKASENYGADLTVQFGRGEFIGDTSGQGSEREQRDRAREIYERVISESKVVAAEAVWARVRNNWGTAGGKIAASFRAGREQAFDESEHPRDEHGKFTDAAGGGDESEGALPPTKPNAATSPLHYGEFKPPQRTITAYKLFRTLKSRPGEIFPTQVGKTQSVPIGEWVPARYVPTKGYAQRPGWHAGTLPMAPQMRSKAGKIQDQYVWAEVRMEADKHKELQAEADKSPTKDLPGQIPKGGWYQFKPNSKVFKAPWIISGAVKVVRVLPDPEVAKILKDAGFHDDAKREVHG